MSDQTEHATGGHIPAPKPGDPPLVMGGCAGVGYLVPVDFGIRIPRDDTHIVLLDAVPVPDHIAHALAAIGALFKTEAR